MNRGTALKEMDAPPAVRSPLRILHVTPSLAPSSGGPATVTTHLAAAQAALGHEVTILSTLHPGQRLSHLAATRSIPDFDAVDTRLYPWSTHVKRWFGTRLFPIYRDLFTTLDVVHLHGVWEPMLLTASLLARKMHVPYIVRPCGMLDPWSLQQRALKKKVALMLSHKKMLDRAACIHSLSTEESRLMTPLAIRSPHIIIPNGVSLEETDAPGEDDFFQQFPQLKSRPYILFLSRLHYKKGLDLLAEAFALVAQRLPEVHLLVVGPDSMNDASARGANEGGNSAPGGARQQLLDIINRHGLSSRVHLPGPLLGPSKFAAYRHAACFCLPSRQEGFSNSIIEALAAGVPVAISTECHFPEVEQIPAGRVFPLQTAAIADALYSLLTLPAADRRHMADSARHYVKQNLTWPHIAAQTITAYEQLNARR